MEEWERLTGFYVVSLIRESKRYAKAKALSLALRLVSEARGILARFYLSLLAVIAAAAGTFALVVRLLDQYAADGGIRLDPAVIISLLMIAGASFWIYRLLGERSWLRVFNIDKYLKELSMDIAHMAPESEPERPSQGISNQKEELRVMIDELIKSRLQEMARADEAYKNSQKRVKEFKKTGTA